MFLRAPDYGFSRKKPWFNGEIQTNPRCFGYTEFVSGKREHLNIVSANRAVAGSGKTKLMSTFIEDLLSNPQDKCCLAYFYCARNTSEPERSNPEDIIRSIVRQMSSLPEVPIPVAEIYEDRKKNHFAAGPLSLEESTDIIIKLAADYICTTIAIDALDECDKNTRHRLLKTLDIIVQRSPSLVKIFVSSRDDQDIVLHLGSSPNLYIKASDNARDIQRYVETEVERAIENKRLLGGQVSKDLRKEIIGTLTKQAQGMFRWVSLQLQNLCSNRINLEGDVREELGRLPQDLASIYSMIYQEISDLGPLSQTIAERSLKWILCSQRKLSIGEFIAAVSIDSRGTFIEVSREKILNICCNLIVLDPELNIFRFAHLSVREFLEQRPDYISTVTHSLAAERCLIICLGNYPVTSANASFRNYAMLYWAIHCQMSENHRSNNRLSGLLDGFLRQQQEGSSPFIKWIQLAKEFLPHYYILDDDIQKRIRSTMSSTDPIFAACIWGFCEIVIKLLGPKPKGGLNGFRSLFKPRENTLGKLSSEGRTCLHYASTYGQWDVVRLLLEHNADVNAKDNSRRTALHMAAQNGHTAVVQQLLEHKADINAKDTHDGGTALHMAVRYGHEAVVQLLIEHKANINVKDNWGRMALHMAAQGGHAAVVQQLLEHKADVNAKDNKGRTALYMAAQKGDEAVVRLLQSASYRNS
ncbi:hypothetical protein GP486_005389 [Trichoglossum hirsutum]|uniref:NACHT domain-containing protein n=1 Tax=Trichoglossum hirsutum TaxID=265104 RepID=A0A9P8L9B7_9PEZI|nr:hypothetical protein GP486_005389 [Trichoglossum hirsutum]